MDNSNKKSSKSESISSEYEERSVSYKPIDDTSKTKAILEHNITEYNKDNPKVKIHLYDDTIKIISRLIRILQSPHECGHAVILSDGFPGLPLSLVKITAYICGFTVFQIHPSSIVLGEKYTIENFKVDIVSAYTTAGLKGEKILFALNETELLDDNFLIYIAEFLVSNSISHLFNEEEHTSITNAIRTEVTQAGLSYTKETAWNFFLKTVRENLRFVFIVSSLDHKFQKRCRQFPSMFNALQTLTLPHWTKDELVANTMYHLKDMTIFDETEKENVAHLLATMHLSIGEHDETGRRSGKFHHVTNAAFERFIEHFVDLARRRDAEIKKEHETISKTLEAMETGAELARQLKNQLEHEKLVHIQKKQGNCSLLCEIGMDKAITEEQVRLVRKQQWKIDKLERLLPRYQDAHERAVFKAAAMIKETKQILAELDQQSLSDLRSMQKPDSDIEDVLAAVIIIVKSPTSDLTWNKGAKRIMANLERFREEIAAFDDVEMTENTLQVVEPYTKRPHFAPGFMEKKTGNSALESLVIWIRGVVKYHRMMISRVRPLHAKVEQTSKALDEAVEKLGGMENKLKNLDNRMSSLSGKFEDASVDKSRQGLLTEEQQLQLSKAAYFEKLLAQGNEQWKKVLNSISNRRMSMVGSVAISAGFNTYLGAYNYDFRRKMIETVWPDCLKDRGVIVDINVADTLTVDITLSVTSMDTKKLVKDLDDADLGLKASREGRVGDKEAEESAKSEDNLGTEVAETITNAGKNDVEVAESVSSELSASNGEKINKAKSFMDSGGHSIYAYDTYCLAVLRLLTGDGLQRRLTTKGINYRELEDLAIINASMQTPLLIIDPYDRAMNLLDFLTGFIVKVDISQKAPSVLTAIEKCITTGDTLVIYNIEEQIDSYLFPIIDHINTKSRLHPDKDQSVIKLNGRRLLIHPTFKLILIHRALFPDFSKELTSTTTVLDLRPHTAGITRFYHMRALERIRPHLYAENSKVYFELFLCLDTLEKFDNTSMAIVRGKQGSVMWDQTELLTDIIKKRLQMTSRFAAVLLSLQVLQRHRIGLIPMANCVVSAFKILLSLVALRHEYQFPLNFVLALFDLSVGGSAVEISEEFTYEGKEDELYSLDLVCERKRNMSLSASNLLAVNIDRIQQAIAIETKDFTNDKKLKESSGVVDGKEAEDDIELPPKVKFDVPPVDDKPIDGISDIYKKFFTMFHKHVSKSLDPQHRALVTALCWLRIETAVFRAPNRDSTLLLLSRRECFDDCTEEQRTNPEWMPERSWNALLAASKQYPQLDVVIKSIEDNSTGWNEWYNSIVVEDMPLPFGSDRNMDDDDDDVKSQNNSHSTSTNDELDDEILKLFTIKFLRPDRFMKAFLKTSLKMIGDLQETMQFNFDQLLSCDNSTAPVLILLPKDHNSGTQQSFSSSVSSLLAKKAEENQVSLIKVSIFDGNEKMINLSLNNAISTGDWILIENLHVGQQKWLKEFTKRLARLKDKSKKDEQWRIFMTTESCDKIPLQLLYLCEKVSVDVLRGVAENQQWWNTQENDTDIRNNVVQSIKSIEEQIWAESRDSSLLYRNLIYMLCVTHGLIITRMKYVPRTFCAKSPINAQDLLDAVNFARRYFEPTKMSLYNVCSAVCKNIYCMKAISDGDKEYFKNLFDRLVEGLSSNHGSSVEFGEWSVAIPPANIDPLQYSSWFTEKLGVFDDTTHIINALNIDVHVYRDLEEQRSDEFIDTLQHLYDLTYQKPFSHQHLQTESIDARKVRVAIDLCKERLPPLLKIDSDFGMKSWQIRSHPQLRSLTPLSEKSALVNENDDLATSISYCLLKECQTFNDNLFRVSTCVQYIDHQLLTGIHTMSPSKSDMLKSLCFSRVPIEWLNEDQKTTQKTLRDWFESLSRSYTQLNTWLRSGLVPKPTAEPTVGHGFLDVVDLGLLANPGRLIAAMKYAKALSVGVSIKEVNLKCFISNSYSRKPTLPAGISLKDGILVKNLYIAGMSWDTKKQCIVKQRSSLEKLPMVFITVNVPDKDNPSSDNLMYFDCPVFINRCRQEMVFQMSLPIDDDDNKRNYIFTDACMVLDPSPVAF